MPFSRISIKFITDKNRMTTHKKPDHKLTSELTLDEFLEVIKLPYAYKFYYPISHFPTDRHLDDFLASIQTRSEQEFRNILRHFIPKSCTYGSDVRIHSTLNQEQAHSSKIKTLEERISEEDKRWSKHSPDLAVKQGPLFHCSWLHGYAC